MTELLKEDAVLRAQVTGRPSEAARIELTRNSDLFRTHLIKRRQFLLDQDELRNVGKN
jgi:hypothetical protein